MEKNINIVEILKDKPVNTKLYSLIFGDVYLSFICANFVTVKHHGTSADYQLNAKLYDYDEAEPSLFPSKEMRDWGKFAWKKGDVLVNKDGNVHIIFDGFEDDTYKKFHGKNYLWEEGGSIVNFEEDEDYMQTSDFNKANKEDAQEYIHKIEKELGGKLNRETLKIEKAQPEFKDGDFVCYTSLDGDKCIGIVKETKNDAIVFHVDYNLWTHSMDFNVSISKENFEFYKSNDLDDEIALNEALYIRYKSWNKEKNILEELKPKVDLKPFDKVLVRDSKSDNWRANLFGYIGKDGYYRCVYANWVYCIPYAGNEHLLGTTNNVEG